MKDLSKKQMEVLCWWAGNSPFADKSGIIADGAVRSGKTLSMSLSFILWASVNFEDTDFALCGKTIGSVRRNVLVPLRSILEKSGFSVDEVISKNFFTVTFMERKNRFYLFGGRDESSAALIQGMTLGGVLFDEVALMPESFVSQALARCSRENAKFFFNCNPESPKHWFFEKFIRRAEERNLLYLHFTMDDNPSLSAKVKRRYKSMYSGAFFERFILGKWVAAEGLVYPEAAKGKFTLPAPPGEAEEYVISVDYGTVNPFSAGLWARRGESWHREDEFFFSSKDEGRQLTDEEYCDEIEKLAGERSIAAVIVDPSAASFIRALGKRGKFPVIRGENDVLNGIRAVQSAFRSGKITIDPRCRDALREFSLYRWEENAKGDCVKKENDHAMDEIRYFVSTYLDRGDFFSVASIERGENE